MALSQTNIASKQRAWKYCQIQAMQAKHISGYYTPYHTIILFELHITIIRDTLAEWYIIECVAVVILTTFRSEC